MLPLQKRPEKWIHHGDTVLVLPKTKPSPSLGVELVTLRRCSSFVRPLSPLWRPQNEAPSPSVSFIESPDVLQQHYLCEGNLFIRRSDSSPCDASDLAHEISVCSHCCHANQFNRGRRMAAHPRTRRENTVQTRTHTGDTTSSAEPDDGTGPESWWQFFSWEWTWRIHRSVFSQRAEGADVGVRGARGTLRDEL